MTLPKPVRHHYIPVFYLKRWAGRDGRLCEFSRPHKDVVPLRRAPSGTGFVDGLYALKGFPPELTQQVEERFFKTVDDGAAEVLRLLEKDGDRALLSVEQRSSWSRFILSLLTRCPEDLANFRNSWAAKMNRVDEEGERRYAEIRGPDDPATLAEYIATEPEEVREKFAFEAYMKLIDNPRIGGKLNMMPWKVVDVDDGRFSLLTSDRPVIRTNGLLVPRGHLALPIGPSKLFVMAAEEETLRGIASVRPRDLVRDCNRSVVESAVRYVYGLSDGQLRYVRAHMGINPEPRLFKQLEARGI